MEAVLMIKFSKIGELTKMNSPLADRIRPENLEQMVGQEHLLKEGKLLYGVIKSGEIPNMVFYGPPGTGKTTLARIISKQTNLKLHKINATTASISDLKEIMSEIGTLMAPNGVLLYIDEIQYFNKKQQQSLLEFIESGKITLIASTTENPYFYIYNALLSRCNVFEFKMVDKNEIKKAILRAKVFLEKENNVEIDLKEEALDYLSSVSNGDVRKSINLFELVFLSSLKKDNKKIIDIELASQASIADSYNKTGDDHYDLLSAFQKSMRGSDPDAAVYYLSRLLKAGELLMACRRLLVCACEDVGLAYPQIIPIVKSCADIAVQVGLPEARIPLADATILVAVSPKSNSAYNAVNSAFEDISAGKVYPIPRNLQNVHCDGSDFSKRKDDTYLYPHAFKNHWVDQQYLPDKLKDCIYYTPGENKYELTFKAYIEKLKNPKE